MKLLLYVGTRLLTRKDESYYSLNSYAEYVVAFLPLEIILLTIQPPNKNAVEKTLYT
jgi:hypothetical protein